MQNKYSTPRLLLNELTLNDAEFIYELVNTPEWIKFIGDRNVKNSNDATVYIQKIIDNPAVKYWVVRTRDKKNPVGIITFIKRDYLDHHDIGFAFLAEYTKQGYASEATMAVLNDLKADPAYTQILAVTIKENSNSIKLLEKSGFRLNKEFQREDEILLLYSMETN